MPDAPTPDPSSAPSAAPSGAPPAAPPPPVAEPDRAGAPAAAGERQAGGAASGTPREPGEFTRLFLPESARPLESTPGSAPTAPGVGDEAVPGDPVPPVAAPAASVSVPPTPPEAVPPASRAPVLPSRDSSELAPGEFTMLFHGGAPSPMGNVAPSPLVPASDPLPSPGGIGTPPWFAAGPASTDAAARGGGLPPSGAPAFGRVSDVVAPVARPVVPGADAAPTPGGPGRGFAVGDASASAPPHVPVAPPTPSGAGMPPLAAAPPVATPSVATAPVAAPPVAAPPVAAPPATPAGASGAANAALPSLPSLPPLPGLPTPEGFAPGAPAAPAGDSPFALPVPGGSVRPPSEYTLRIKQSITPPVPADRAPAAATAAATPAPARRSTPVALIVVINVIVVATVALVLYFVLRPTPAVPPSAAPTSAAPTSTVPAAPTPAAAPR